MTDYDVADELLVPAVHEAADLIVRAAHSIYPQKLPRLRSQAFLDAPMIVRQAVLVIGGESLVLGDPARVLLRQVSNDIHAGDQRFWRDWAANRVPYDELKRRRAA